MPSGMYNENPVLKVGKFTIAYMSEKKEDGFWIRNTETEEGDQFRLKDVEPYIQSLWDKLF